MGGKRKNQFLDNSHAIKIALKSFDAFVPHVTMRFSSNVAKFAKSALLRNVNVISAIYLLI